MGLGVSVGGVAGLGVAVGVIGTVGVGVSGVGVLVGVPVGTASPAAFTVIMVGVFNPPLAL